MPDLGKAVYTLVLNTTQYDVALTKSEARTNAATAGIESSVGRANAAVASMGGVSTRTAAEIQGSSAKMAASMEEVGVAAQAEATQVVAANSRIAASGKAAASGIGATGKAMEKSGKAWMHATLPLAAALGVAAHSAIEFQQDMTLIQTQAGYSAQSVGMLTKQVLELAKHSTQGPNELAKGLYHLKALGLNDATAMGVLAESSKGAMLGLANLEETTSALGASVRTHIKGTEDYSKAMATLMATAGAGNMRMEDMIAALGTGVLPTAKLAGLSLKDVGGALALMTDEAIPAVQAMTRFKTALMLMASPSAAAEKSLAKIGLTGKDLGLAFQGPHGLLTALELIKKKLGETYDLDTKAGRAGAFRTLSRGFGGARGASTVMLLVNQIDVLRQKYRQIDRISSRYNANVLASSKTMGNQLKLAWSNVQVALIGIGNQVAPIVVQITKGIAIIANGFGKLPQPMKVFLTQMGLIAVAAGPVLYMVGRLGRLMGLLAITSNGAATGVTRFRFATLGLGGQLMLVAAGTWAVYSAVTALDRALGSPMAHGANSVGGFLAGKLGHNDLSAKSQADAKALHNNAKRIRATYNDLTKRAGMTRKQALQRMVDMGLGEYKDLETLTGMRSTKASRAADQLERDELARRAGMKKHYQDQQKAKEKRRRWKEGADARAQARAAAARKPGAIIIPYYLQIQESEAAQTTSTADDKRVLRKELQIINEKLKDTKISARRRLELVQEQTRIVQQLQGYTEAEQKKQAKLRKNMAQIPIRLQIQETQAERTATLSDDIRIYKVELAWLKKRLQNSKLRANERLSIEKQITAIEKKLTEDIKKQKAAQREARLNRLKEIQAAMDLRGTFLGEFAPSVFGRNRQGQLTLGAQTSTAPGGKVVHYNQHNHFNEIPKDRHRLSRQMREATSAAMS